jgi:hypothetical protein
MEPPQLFFLILGIIFIAISPVNLYLYYRAIKSKSTHFPLMRANSVFKYRKWNKENNNLIYTFGVIKLLSSFIIGFILGIVFIFIGLFIL